MMAWFCCLRPDFFGGIIVLFAGRFFGMHFGFV
jgi:hypothetical protein